LLILSSSPLLCTLKCVKTPPCSHNLSDNSPCSQPAIFQHGLKHSLL
jgi:hypothetical protein